MALGLGVIDQLVVKLTYDSRDYDKAKKEFDARSDAAERSEKDKDNARKSRDKSIRDALVSQTKAADGLARSVAKGAAGMLALGAAAGAAMTRFTSAQTDMRRFGQAAGMTTQQVAAMSATVKRLGAGEGAMDTIGRLAQQARTGYLTGDVGLLTALQSVGIQAGPGAKVEDMLQSAQDRYRSASGVQRDEMERMLLAQGVGPDLLTMMKSDRNVSDVYQQSLKESVPEDRKALDQVTETLTTLGKAADSVAGVLVSAFGPELKSLGQWASDFASKAANFTAELTSAGGGARLLGEKLGLSAATMDRFGRTMDGVGSLIVNGWRLIFDLVGRALDKILGSGVAKALSGAWDTVNKWLDGANKSAEQALPGGADGGAAPATGDRGKLSQAQILQELADPRYGLSPGAQAGYAANIMRESGGDTGAVNLAGGGNGARGLFQWRGARLAAFRARYGISPEDATLQQQLDFALLSDDPEEMRSRRAVERSAIAAGGSARAYGAAVSSKFERHMDPAEDARRAELASSLSTYNIQNMTVVANDPDEFRQGMQRQSQVDGYNSGQL